MVNPFTERGRITDPHHFTGRWSELALIFERLEARRPVLISGVAGIGKSSLLTHLTQSAAINLELSDLRAYYLDLAVLDGAAQFYRIVNEAMRHPGETLAALEVALVAVDAPVLLCLDNAHLAIEAGWGEKLLEALARLARGTALMLVVTFEGEPPLLSERFAVIRLGAMAQAEVRLLTETYLENSGVRFTPTELHELIALSVAHPAYLQRAAFFLFESKRDPGFDWRSAYLAEARNRPVPGAPLPPALFEGQLSQATTLSSVDDSEAAAAPGVLQQRQLPETPRILLFVGLLLLGILVGLLSKSPALAILVVIIAGVGVYALSGKRGADGGSE